MYSYKDSIFILKTYLIINNYIIYMYSYKGSIFYFKKLPNNQLIIY